MRSRIQYILNRRWLENFALMSIVIFVIGLCALHQFGVEAGLKIDFEDLTIAEIDQKYFDPEKTKGYVVEDEETDETTISSTLSLIKKPPPETEVHLVVTAMSMGKYTVPTGIELKMKLCEMFNEPIIMAPISAVLGFSQDSCPPEPGIYSQEGYKLSMENFPDEFPENKYLVYFEMMLKGKPMIAVNIYQNVRYE